MNDIKISIIVPVYNIEQYVVNTVHSICNQTYRNLEIILVNDGSKDTTPILLEQLAKEDSRIKVIHKENGGVTEARLTGVEMATGEWIGFVDGDDYIETHMYEMLLNNAVQYRADISHCGYQMVFPSRTDFYYGTGRLAEQDKKTGLKDLLEGSFVEPGLWNKLFHKTLFQSLLHNRQMDLSIKNNEDLLMNYYLFSKAKKSVFVDKCPYHYLVRNGSAATSKINENKLRDPLKVLKILEKETKLEKELQFIVKEKMVAQLIALSTLQFNGQAQLIGPYRKNARKELRKMLPEILKSKYAGKQKIMALWVAVWPDSYSIIHRIYLKITGLDRKYEVV